MKKLIFLFLLIIVINYEVDVVYSTILRNRHDVNEEAHLETEKKSNNHDDEEDEDRKRYEDIPRYVYQGSGADYDRRY